MSEVERDSRESESPAATQRDIGDYRRELAERCIAAEITSRVDTFDELQFSLVDMPSGREKRTVALIEPEDFALFLSVPFEKYTFLGDYDAICRYDQGVIEAAVRSVDLRGPGAVARALFGEPEDAEVSISLQRRPERDAEEVRLSSPSACLVALTQRRLRGPGRLALVIEHCEVRQHDQALKLLERLANAIFFQLDLLRSVPLTLAKRRRRTGPRPRLPCSRSSELVFPRHEYDDAPMSLYWYGRSAVGMPLLQFLAFYQTIEYYFPTYSKAEAQRRARAVLKDPAFRADRDADIGRLLTTMSGFAGGVGEERAQLKATIQECVDARALRQYLESDPERKEFFTTKVEGLTDKRISIGNPNADLRNDVGDRVYDIRCKIVHTKSGSHERDFELLLPFSREAESLYYDVDIVQWLAQRVLIAASSPLRL
jgi:hypothetical protein